MLVNDNGRWFTTNAYHFGHLSPGRRSLFDIDNDMKRREIIKKHFTVEADKGSSCCFLMYHGTFISAWSKGNRFAAHHVIQAAVNTYIAMGGK